VLILIIDTGSQGHAIRGLFNLLRRVLPNDSPKTDVEIEIVGIVDGDNPEWVPDAAGGAAADANTLSCSKMAKSDHPDERSLPYYPTPETSFHAEPSDFNVESKAQLQRRVDQFFFADIPGKVGGLRLMGVAASVL
jgi:hypothetical protein